MPLGTSSFQYSQGLIAEVTATFPGEAELHTALIKPDVMSVELFLERHEVPELLAKAKNEWKERPQPHERFVARMI